MKHVRIAALAIPFLFGCSMTFASHTANHVAHEPAMSFQQALDVIEKAGYKNIHKIELEHNRYEVEAMDANGKEMKFHICPKTGAITMDKDKKHHGKHHAKHHVKHAKKTSDAAAEDKAPAQ